VPIIIPKIVSASVQAASASASASSGRVAPRSALARARGRSAEVAGRGDRPAAGTHEVVERRVGENGDRIEPRRACSRVASFTSSCRAAWNSSARSVRSRGSAGAPRAIAVGLPAQELDPGVRDGS
jgi:hypothetical protein